MRPKRIILVRHGESEGNVDKTIYTHTPDHRIELTEKGREQARRAGRKIKKLTPWESITAYVSPLMRTRQTYQEIAGVLKSNKEKWHPVYKVKEDPRIREQEWGNYATDSRDYEKARDEFGTFFYRFPDGESGADVFDRLSTFLETLHRDFQKDCYTENALIVTHGFTLRVFLMRWFHWTVEQFEDLRNPANGQVVVLEKYQCDDTYSLRSKLRTRGNVEQFIWGS